MSQEHDDQFKEEVAAEIEKLLAGEPQTPSKEPPKLPEEPEELVSYWRKIIDYRDQLCALITKWEMVPFQLGEIPQQNLRDLYDRLTTLDSEIVTKARWQANDRGHSVAQLRELADLPSESERQRKAYWVQLWLTDRSPITRSTVEGELGRADLEDLERDARADLGNQYRQIWKVARCMVDIAAGVRICTPRNPDPKGDS